MTTRIPNPESRSPASSAFDSTHYLRKLHALARERQLGHDDLHDYADEFFHVSSLRDLDVDQLRQFCEFLAGRSVPASRVPRPESRTPPRRVHARGSDDPHKMRSPAQLALIGKLRYEIGWDAPTLDRVIEKQWSLPGLAAVLTSAQAAKVIQYMIARNRQRMYPPRERWSKDVGPQMTQIDTDE